jgi:hypothetical protein
MYAKVETFLPLETDDDDDRIPVGAAAKAGPADDDDFPTT